MTELDAEKGVISEESQMVIDTVRSKQPLKFGVTVIDKPSPDYMKWSIASIFVCFCWGILAVRASYHTRKCNKQKDYPKAYYSSLTAQRHSESALACFVVLLFIVGVPLGCALLSQGTIL